MSNNVVKKPYFKLVAAAIFAIVGIALFVWISLPQADFSKISASEITTTQEAVVSDFYLLGKMGSKTVGTAKSTYYVIMAQDKSGTKFTMGMCVDEETADEFEQIISSSESAKLISKKFYGSIEAMDQSSAETYDSLLEEYGYASTYPNLYFVFTDSGNSSSANGGLGLIFLIPFLAFAAFFVISYIKSVNKAQEYSR